MIKLPAYLYQSRHGVFYFRWPIPNAPESRQTVRISLQTRCPKRASLLARHLASCGESLRLQLVGSTMRYDETRSYVQGMLQEWLKKTIERLDREGPLHNYNLGAEASTITLLEAGSKDYWDLVGAEEEDRILNKIASFAHRPRADFDTNKTDTLELFRTGYIAYWQAVAAHRQKLQMIDLGTSSASDGATSGGPSETLKESTISGPTLAEVVKLYIEDPTFDRKWTSRTRAKRAATLAVLVELIGGDTPMAAITKKHVQDVRLVVLKLPSNKNKNPLTRDLSLRDAAKVPGVQGMSTQTLNDYFGTFHAFTEWSSRLGYCKEGLFAGINAGTSKSKDDKGGREAFTPTELALMVHELTRPDSALVKKESNRWASLIAIFTGSRLDEVCGLRVSDVQEVEGILCISINDDDPDGKKHLKTRASRRIVPVHSQLIELGFQRLVDQARQRGSDARLFPDFSYSVGNGYERNQSRWFNERFLTGLGLKSKEKVLHGLRHAMTTQLNRADVPEPMVQSIVGHQRKGMSMDTYFKKGFKMSQLKDAIEKFVVDASRQESRPEQRSKGRDT